MLCPYQSLPELLWLYQNEPKQWETWVQIEQNKINRDKDKEGTLVNGKPFKNHGVFCSSKLLPQKLFEAQTKYGHLTQQELHQYKKFHGCQTNSF
jgi:hypothetical protein